MDLLYSYTSACNAVVAAARAHYELPDDPERSAALQQQLQRLREHGDTEGLSDAVGLLPRMRFEDGTDTAFNGEYVLLALDRTNTDVGYNGIMEINYTRIMLRALLQRNYKLAQHVVATTDALRVRARAIYALLMANVRDLLAQRQLVKLQSSNFDTLRVHVNVLRLVAIGLRAQNAQLRWLVGSVTDDGSTWFTRSTGDDANMQPLVDAYVALNESIDVGFRDSDALPESYVRALEIIREQGLASLDPAALSRVQQKEANIAFDGIAKLFGAAQVLSTAFGNDDGSGGGDDDTDARAVVRLLVGEPSAIGYRNEVRDRRFQQAERERLEAQAEEDDQENAL